MCTFNRNNRTCIHLLQPDKKFIDFTEEEDYYLCNDELNSAGIETDDLVKFRLLNNDNVTTQRVYGFIQYIDNVNHTTFMICEHYDENGDKFYLDYVYSSFHHAFRRLNHHGSFSDWNQLTHIKFAHAPEWFVKEWIDEHVTTDETEEEFEGTCDNQNYTDTETESSKPDKEPAADTETVDMLDMLYNLYKQFEVLNNKLDTATTELSERLKNTMNKFKQHISSDEESQKKFKDITDELSNRIDIIGKTAVQAYTKTKGIKENECLYHVMC